MLAWFPYVQNDAYLDCPLIVNKVDKLKVSANENKLKIVDEKAAIQRHVGTVPVLNFA